MKAIWNNKVIAESTDIVNIEGNAYFPIESINTEYFKSSDTKSVCPWKGTASYYHLQMEGSENKDAAWLYQTPNKLAESITNRIAFWKGVEIIDD
ncbi:DUF427 domain-containing protein [Labilibacter marinus]|uniref:DUF427 domain-containing protein n=1 Tax=Labilibacter marinus TaxID=1477105 RepID=UPI0008375FEF|nr:DUF427 domain-containing protein [Labilibacter marinus]